MNTDKQEAQDDRGYVCAHCGEPSGQYGHNGFCPSAHRIGCLCGECSAQRIRDEWDPRMGEK